MLIYLTMMEPSVLFVLMPFGVGRLEFLVYCAPVPLLQSLKITERARGSVYRRPLSV